MPNTLTIDERMERWEKQYKEAHACNCPHCGYDLTTESEDMVNIVTYWGEDGRVEEHCNHCGKDFWVEEHVDRTWTTFKTEDEEEDDGF